MLSAFISILLSPLLDTVQHDPLVATCTFGMVSYGIVGAIHLHGLFHERRKHEAEKRMAVVLARGEE